MLQKAYAVSLQTFVWLECEFRALVLTRRIITVIINMFIFFGDISMANVTLQPGTIFSSSGGQGVVLPDGNCVLIAGGGRLHHSIVKTSVPTDAVTANPSSYEASIAFVAVKTAFGI
jgi:hypothetical protein